MVRVRLLLAVALLPGLLAACGDDLAEPPQPTVAAPPPAPEPPAASASDEDAEFKVPDVWCGTDMDTFGVRPVRAWPSRWEEVSPGLWRRAFYKPENGKEAFVVEWGEDRDGRFFTWQEVIDSGERPLWGTPRIPDRPGNRPPR